MPPTRKMCPKTVLSSEEKHLEKWILSKALLGFPMHSDKVRDSVQKEAHRENIFKDDRPGKNDYVYFFSATQNIAQRKAEIISKARAIVTEENNRDWFITLRQYLRDENCEDIILEDPQRIFNADESSNVSVLPFECFKEPAIDTNIKILKK